MLYLYINMLLYTNTLLALIWVIYLYYLFGFTYKSTERNLLEKIEDRLYCNT